MVEGENTTARQGSNPRGASPLTVFRADPPTRPPYTPKGRRTALDRARGLAVLGMALFHLDWDLAYFGWTSDPQSSLPWRIFGHLVAGTFLFLSGIGLVLAAPKGGGAALRRLAVIAAAALAVTLATLALFPDEAIVFGILHCLVVTNALALTLRRAPSGTVALGALLALVAPLAWPRFEGIAWWWTGLSAAAPRTLDYRPVFPALGLVLGGVLTGRLAVYRRLPTAASPAPKALAWIGRHSLPIYLAHQPVLFGLALAVSFVLPPQRAELTTGFVSACRAECVATGANASLCETACGCAAARSLAGLGPLGSKDMALPRIAAACFGNATSRAGPVR